MLQPALLFLCSIASAEPELVEYEAAESAASAHPLEKGEGVLRALGLSQYQLSDRVQIRGALLAEVVFPHIDVKVDLGDAGDKGHWALELFAVTPMPYLGVAGLGVGVLGNYTHTTRSYRPDYINLSFGTALGGFAGFQGGSAGYWLPLIGSVGWDHRLDARSRLKLDLTTSMMVGPADPGTAVGAVGTAGVGYLYLVGPVRVGGGARWTVPGFTVENPVLASLLPFPYLDLYVRL